MSRARRRHPFLLLVLARMRELMREPEVVFWVFIFPILLAVGLGIAFRNKPPDEIAVGVVDAAGSGPILAALTPAGGFAVETISIVRVIFLVFRIDFILLLISFVPAILVRL